MLDLTKQADRMKLAQSIESDPNKARKQWSQIQFEVQSGRIQQYVKENLEGQYDVQSVREMPIVSSLNIQKRIVSKKATIYKKPPQRKFSELSDEQSEKLTMIYRDMKLNQKLNQANKGFIYQEQAIGMIVPKNGKLICRVFKMHQIDAIPNDIDPESSAGFVISVFDRENYQQLYQDKKQKDVATGNRGRSVRSHASPIDGVTSEVANEMQFKRYVERYVVWTPEFNYIQNGLGELLDPETMKPSSDVDIISPLAQQGIMPFFEASREKDFEYFVRSSNALTDFTVEFNARMTDESNNIKMNGYAVGILKAPSDLQPENQVVGAAMLLRLKTDGTESGDVDFSFVSPNSNIGEISQANDKFLNYFITSEGLGADAINASGQQEKAASGLDRFIQGLEKVSAHQDDYEVFRDVENQVYKIVKAWLVALNGSTTLDRKYQMVLPEDSEINVDFDKPEMVLTPSEKLDKFERELDLGLISRVGYLMECKNMSRDEALEYLKQINEDETEADEIKPPPAPIIELPEPDMDLDASDDESDDESEDEE